MKTQVLQCIAMDKQGSNQHEKGHFQPVWKSRQSEPKAQQSAYVNSKSHGREKRLLAQTEIFVITPTNLHIEYAPRTPRQV